MNLNPQNQRISTLDQVESWLNAARQLGYRVRYDHFGGTGGGVCEFGGQKWIFMDVALSGIEQLEILETEIPKDAAFDQSLLHNQAKRAA